MVNSPRNTNNLSIANPHYNLGTWYVKCVFSWKQWVLTTHCFFSGHRESQRAPLLLLRNVEAHDHQYLHIFISFTNFYLHFPAQEWRWLGRRSAAPRRKPQGQHGDVPGQQHRRGVQQRRGCKRGQFRRQQDNLLYNCYIMVLCVDQCDMAPISAHPYLSLILINWLDFGSKKKV